MTITLRSGAFDAYLWLYNQNKQQIASNDDGAGDGNSRISFRLAVGQTYYVEATSYSTGGRGAYILTAGNGVLTAIATPWPPLPLNLTPYQPNGWSDKIVVSRATGTTLDDTDLTSADTLFVDFAEISNGSGATSARFYVELYVDGVLKHSWYNDPPVDPNEIRSTTDYSIGSLAAGVHNIKVKVDSSGAIAESNENDNEYTKTIIIGTGQTVNGTLTNADAESHGRTGTRADYYMLTCSRNVTITLRSGVFDAYLFLYNQNKQQLDYNDDGAGNRNSRISYNLVAGQTYYVEATAYDTGARGAYALTSSSGTLTVVESPWPSAPPMAVAANGAWNFGDITAAGESDWYSFRTPIAGDYLIETSANGLVVWSDTVMHLYGPDSNVTPITSDDDSGNLLFSKITSHLEANKTYYVKVEGYRQTTGSYILTIREATNPTLVFNIAISFDYEPTQAPIAELERGIRQASSFLWLSTAKQARFGRVDVYNSSSHRLTADIVIYNEPHRADANWDWNISLIPPRFRDAQIALGTMADGGFSVAAANDEFLSVGWSALECYSTIVHEFGHYQFHLLDEYLIDKNTAGAHCPDTGDRCVMDYPFATPVGFCVPANHDTNQDTYQQKENGKSCCEIMKQQFAPFRVPAKAIPAIERTVSPEEEVGPFVEYLIH